MTKAFAICAIFGLAACGGKRLDLGGENPDGGRAPGRLSTAIITHQRNAASLHSEGSYLYWTTYDASEGDRAYQLCRCRKHDCAATRVSLFQTREAGRLLIRNRRAYFRHNSGIAGCSVDDCSAPTVIVARASTAPSAVDDTHVYWGSNQDNALLSCPLTGCDEPSVALTGLGPMIDAGVDDGHFFWTVWESSTKQRIRSAAKYGSPVNPSASVLDLPVISSFGLDDGFVYWGENVSSGRLARTRKVLASVPEPRVHVLALGQYYPRALAIDYDVLFWMNEAAPEDQLGMVERPAKIMSCILPTCETSIEVLEDTAGGSLANPVGTYFGDGMLVVDAEAIYYIGDVAKGGSSNQSVDASIRRLQRRPDR